MPRFRPHKKFDWHSTVAIEQSARGGAAGRQPLRASFFLFLFLLLVLRAAGGRRPRLIPTGAALRAPRHGRLPAAPARHGCGVVDGHQPLLRALSSLSPRSLPPTAGTGSRCRPGRVHPAATAPSPRPPPLQRDCRANLVLEHPPPSESSRLCRTTARRILIENGLETGLFGSSCRSF